MEFEAGRTTRTVVLLQDRSARILWSRGRVVLLRVFVLPVLLLCSGGAHAQQATAQQATHRQYRTSEFDFTTGAVLADPLESPFFAIFTGPGGVSYEVPGFWDGGTSWKVRFTPTLPGLWSYETFCVLTAETELFDSGVRYGNDAAVYVDLNIQGAVQLRLLVTDGGDNNAWDHADWADAKLMGSGDTTTYLQNLNPSQVEQQHGELALGTNLLGDPLGIGGQLFQYGLGTHAYSEIVYPLESNPERFQAWVGLDDLTGSNGSVRFIVRASFPAEQVAELHGRQGSFTVDSAVGDNPLHQHGGLLKVSENGRYLTFTDGTPFFWLGDTWWWSPSDLMPFEGSSNPSIPSCFKHVVDYRANQGYTVAQMTFLSSTSNGVNHFSDFAATQTIDPTYWQDVDRSIEYANAGGIVPVIGLAFHSGMDQLTLDQWQMLWRYVIARYGAHSVSWLICGEYNQSNVAPRVEKTLALGQFIKSIDPYARAMTVHPWWYAGEGQQAWDASWYDFTMLQGAHEIGLAPSVGFYSGVYNRTPAKPMLESECRYEGIRGFTDSDVRHVAYRAIQSGSFGYTYGSHGLWYPTQDENDSRFSEWGTPLVWWEALERPGGAQMQHLRACYESVEWWKLSPRPGGVQTPGDPLDEEMQILVSARADLRYLVYFPAGLSSVLFADLIGLPAGASYSGQWFDLRSGAVASLPAPLSVQGSKLQLPSRPDSQDWMLILRLRTPPADFDADGDVDHEDVEAFGDCISGPTIPLTPGCEAKDLDDDNDVDLSDFGLVQRCLSGEGVLSNPACAD